MNLSFAANTNKSWAREMAQLVKGLILRTYVKVKGGNFTSCPLPHTHIMIRKSFKEKRKVDL